MKEDEQIVSSSFEPAQRHPAKATEEGAMIGSPRLRLWPLRLLGGLAVAWLAAVILVTGLASPAVAHEGEKSTPARTLAQIAVAIIRTQPEQLDAAGDKINDAIEAEDHTGLDVGLVKQAQQAFQAGDMAKTELLLEQALGACPGQPVTTPNPNGIRGGLPTPASPCPAPAAHELGLGRVRTQGPARVSLLAIAAVFILGGLVLTRRIRER